jgi:hypothetical protein
MSGPGGGESEVLQIEGPSDRIAGTTAQRFVECMAEFIEDFPHGSEFAAEVDWSPDSGVHCSGQAGFPSSSGTTYQLNRDSGGWVSMQELGQSGVFDDALTPLQAAAVVADEPEGPGSSSPASGGM